MKYCNYETYGIHSRLKNIITKCGGYDKYESAKLLISMYKNIDFDIAIEMCKTSDIWDRLKTNGLKYEIEKAKRNKRNNEIKFASVLASLSNLNKGMS